MELVSLFTSSRQDHLFWYASELWRAFELNFWEIDQFLLNNQLHLDFVYCFPQDEHLDPTLEKRDESYSENEQSQAKEDSNHKTLMQAAIERKNLRWVILLIKYGADVTESCLSSLALSLSHDCSDPIQLQILSLLQIEQRQKRLENRLNRLEKEVFG